MACDAIGMVTGFVISMVAGVAIGMVVSVAIGIMASAVMRMPARRDNSDTTWEAAVWNGKPYKLWHQIAAAAFLQLIPLGCDTDRAAFGAVQRLYRTDRRARTSTHAHTHACMLPLHSVRAHTTPLDALPDRLTSDHRHKPHTHSKCLRLHTCRHALFTPRDMPTTIPTCGASATAVTPAAAARATPSFSLFEKGLGTAGPANERLLTQLSAHSKRWRGNPVAFRTRAWVAVCKMLQRSLVWLGVGTWWGSELGLARIVRSRWGSKAQMSVAKRHMLTNGMCHGA